MRSCDRNNSRFQPDNRFSIADKGELLPEQTQIITIYNCSTKNEVEGAYNKALYLAQRRIMMQGWADFLDKARDTAKADRPMKARNSVKQLNAMSVRALRPIA